MDDKSIGCRLDQILQKRFSDLKSQRKRSDAFGFPNTTVIGWINGTTPISGEACQRLIELGCDLNWVLTGRDSNDAMEREVRKIDPVQNSNRVELIKMQNEFQAMFQSYQVDLLEGRVSEKQFGKLLKAAVSAVNKTAKELGINKQADADRSAG